ncbi:MAG: DEAD/DEAH box helicase [Thermovirgaceae bacterium]
MRVALTRRGIESLYSHQAKAIEATLSGRNVVTVTPTASGKTLCYNIPVLDAIMKDNASRALYIFPTKALSQDQLTELYGLIQEAGAPVKTFTYDGDTPPSVRTKLRAAGHIVITNPDMLNTGILPHHTKWVKLFENLRYVVIDELHTYRGVFGSHVANLIRRLKRICAFYGSNPRFICSSATISNPKDHAERLLEAPVEIVAENGAPSGEKRIVLYNPPVVNSQLGIRKSSLKETARIAGNAVSNGISTIVFTRSRINVELLLTYIRKALRQSGLPADSVAGYRGGYLPNERRAIERRLRDGSLSCVISTNALELGIDIGSLELAVLHGYPGSVASTWQQMGRAGRRSGISAAVMVASSFALDQFLASRPDYFFGASPEQARINADNLYILVSHLKCGAFELPFDKGERFGEEDPEEILEYLEAQGILHHAGGRYHWQADSFPAESLSLRSATSENYVITDITETANPVVIGEVDRPSAPMLIHPEAIYFHGGESYQVTELDSKGMRCYVRKVDADYYTDADMAVRFQVIDTFDTQNQWGWGEVLLASRPTVYKKIRLHTHENVGYGHIHLPEDQMHTTACWFFLPTGIVWEGWSEDRRSSALTGLAHLLKGTVPLFLMCDRHDLRIHSMVKDPFLGGPAIYIADNYPGGVGLAEAAYGLRKTLLKSAAEALEGCPCEDGCPACVGAMGSQMHSKRDTRFLLDTLLEKSRGFSRDKEPEGNND